MNGDKTADNPDLIEETVSAREDVEAKEKVNEDPFFATGHFSFHHQPEDDLDEAFMGE